MSDKCYCPKCGSVVEPVKKFHVTVWEQVQRCQTVEVVAATEADARRQVRAAYQERRDEEFAPDGWEEDRAASKPIHTGTVGRPSTRKLKGENRLLGMEVEETEE